MKLTEYLQLNDKEIIFKNELLSVYKLAEPHQRSSANKTLNAPLLHLLNDITEADVSTVLKAALSDPKFDAACRLPQLEEHWKNLWRQCGPKEPQTVEYLPMSTLSCFELLKGIFVYEGYRKLINESKDLTTIPISEAEDYLTLAADCGCFFALNALCVRGLELAADLADTELRKTKIAKVLSYAEKCANWYWTPGYLLLSNILQELSAIDVALNQDVDKLAYKEKLFSEALEAMQIAQKLEEISENMIHNAYQGRTIKEASKNKITSWLQAKLKIQEQANGLLKHVDVATPNERVKSKVKNIFDLFAKDIQTTRPDVYKSTLNP